MEYSARLLFINSNSKTIMARMLADRDSTDLHLNLARRHQRLARRYQQTALVAAIQPIIDELAARQTNAATKELDRQTAYDLVVAADGDMDDAIRNLFGAAQAADRDQPGTGVVAMLFPSGGFGGIVETPLAQEPAAAEALAVKVTTLGGTHPLASHAAKLTALAGAVRDALQNLDGAVRAAKNAAAEEEIAQAALRRQYEHNYLDARRAVGRVLAERMFAKTNRGAGAAADETPASPAS